MIPDSMRTSTVGYGNHGLAGHIDVDALILAVSEGHCPGCSMALSVHPMATFHHAQVEPWGCCKCCGRGWLLEMRDAGEPPYVIATACRLHGTTWDCDHPLPGGTWTAKQHAQAAPAIRMLAVQGA